MKKKGRFPVDKDGVIDAVQFIDDFLTAAGIKRKEFIRARLVAEEAITALASNADEGSNIHVHVRSFLGTVTMNISSHGKQFNPIHHMNVGDELDSNDDDIDSTTQDTMRGIILNAMSEGLKYSHKDGINRLSMTAVKSRHRFLFATLGSMLVAILAGILLSNFAGSTFNDGLNEYVLTPVKTMYMNALKMCVAPVVFFSIIACVVQFTDLSELGRIGGKVFASYLLTTVLAVGVGLGIYFLFQPGDAGIAAGTIADASSITSQKMDVSLLGTLISVVPNNVIQPFLDSNMLQLIFMAILGGIAVGLIGKHSQILRDILMACNDLFLKITTLIIRVMPIAVFCSICSMILSLGLNTMVSVLGMLGVFLLGLLCMMVVYCLLMMSLGHISPIPFLKKYVPTMLQVLSMASSNASIPLNMDACKTKLGISSRVYSLSIPLGATINMDGTCIHLAIFSLALAKVYGVEISGAAILSLIVSIIVLSMGAPGIPGSGLICLSVLLTQIGVPVEAIGIVMGIDSLAGMFRTASNCLGDVAVTTIVAKSEGLLDMEMYKAKG